MAVFDTLISDTGSRFGLGSSAGPLVRETLNMVANAPGGIGGFLSKLESAGLRSQIGILARTPQCSAPVGTRSRPCARLRGAERDCQQARHSRNSLKTAVGYTLPKLIGALTPGGRIPTESAVGS